VAGKVKLFEIIAQELKTMNYFPKSRSKEIVVQNLNRETLVYDLVSNKALCLNETSMLIWQMCDGENSISDIVQDLSRRLKRTISEDLVRLAIDQLKKENLLENSEEIQIELAGLSRREMIRQAGLASAAALPVISALVAPSAAMALSSCSNPGGAAPTTLVGICGPGAGPATQSGCTVTCQNVYGSSCASCTNSAIISPAIPGSFECRCL
jgi:hypothetical protein